jgi:SAM-dependent methyltransferase
VSVQPEPNSRADWNARYATSRTEEKGPSRWIVQQSRALPKGALVCDVAGGTGRHAAPLVALGHRVVLLDFAEQAVRDALEQSRATLGVVADAKALPLRDSTFDVVVVTNFLDRDLIPAFVALLKPGGHLLYETYTTEHATLVAAGLARAPRSSRYLLKPGELRALVSQLSVVDYREEQVEDEAGRRHCASLHAIRLGTA